MLFMAPIAPMGCICPMPPMPPPMPMPPLPPLCTPPQCARLALGCNCWWRSASKKDADFQMN